MLKFCEKKKKSRHKITPQKRKQNEQNVNFLLRPKLCDGADWKEKPEAALESVFISDKFASLISDIFVLDKNQ